MRSSEIVNHGRLDLSKVAKRSYICINAGTSNTHGGEDEQLQSSSAATREKAITAATSLLWRYRHAHSR